MMREVNDTTLKKIGDIKLCTNRTTNYYSTTFGVYRLTNNLLGALIEQNLSFKTDQYEPSKQ